MDDGRTISEYGIQNLKDVTFYLVLSLRGGGPRDTKQSLGLVNTAQAISLWDWDGIMPGPVKVSLTLVVYRQVDLLLQTQGNHATGLRLSKGEVVTVGRIVNDEWYQGFNNKEICGYFPRAFVSVRK